MSVMRKHRLAERLLCDVIGLDWELVHEEACRWEHVMSDQVEERLVGLLDEHTTSPYGNPIPEHGYAEGPYEPSQAVPLTQVAGDEDTQTVIEWIAEPLQVDSYLLAQLRQTGVVPGARVAARVSGDYITVGAPGADDVLDLPPDTAAHIFVTR